MTLGLPIYLLIDTLMSCQTVYIYDIKDNGLTVELKIRQNEHVLCYVRFNRGKKKLLLEN